MILATATSKLYGGMVEHDDHLHSKTLERDNYLRNSILKITHNGRFMLVSSVMRRWPTEH